MLLIAGVFCMFVVLLINFLFCPVPVLTFTAPILIMTFVVFVCSVMRVVCMRMMRVVCMRRVMCMRVRRVRMYLRSRRGRRRHNL